MRVFSAFTTAVLLSGAELPTSDIVLASPLRTATMNVLLDRQVVPKWEHGSLLTFSPDRPEVRVFDGSGNIRFDVEVHPPESLQVQIRDLSAAPNGRFAVAGTAYGEGGAYSQFLAWLDSSGKIDKYSQINDAGILKICFGPDNALWALVRVFGDKQEFKEVARYDLLRRYDSDGKLTRTAVPRSQFPERRHPGHTAKLVASGSSIGVYFVRSRTWIELSPEGAVRQTLRTDLPPDLEVSGVAMTEDQVLLTTYGTDEEHGALKPALYHLDRELGHWSAVDASVIRIGKKPLLLFGYDGDALVLSTGLPKLSWVAVSR